MIMVLVASILLAAQAGPPGLDPQAILQRIAETGAKPTVDSLSRANAWEAVIARIGDGDAAWVALAPRLADGTDASTSETLGIALAEALPRNPRAVLAVLDPSQIPLSPAEVCSAPFLEGSLVDLPAYKARTLKRLAALQDPRLAAMRDACMAQLRR